MKQLPLFNRHYKHLLKGYTNWLSVLGYSEATVYNNPILVIEFLFYLEQNSIDHIRLVDIQTVNNYMELLKNRDNFRRGGKLSDVHINGHIKSLRKFTTYLWNTKRINLPTSHLKHIKLEKKSKDILTIKEIGELYNSTTDTVLGMRDKAMLSLYYGCGLRRNEGISLDVDDILLSKQLVYVRKGKNNKERYVPIMEVGLEYLKQYIEEYRPKYLTKNKTEPALFISQRGKRVNSQSLLLRLKQLIDVSESETLKTKTIGLHTLRHSIATHLLQKGMPLEQISNFLGHSSLESTQIYTHIVNEIGSEEI